MVRRHRERLVINRRGGKERSLVERASKRNVCQVNSLNKRMNPISVSFKRVNLKSEAVHVGEEDSSNILENCNNNQVFESGLLKLMINALTLTVIPSTTLSEKPYLLPVVVYCDGFEVEVCSLNSEVVPIET